MKKKNKYPSIIQINGQTYQVKQKKWDTKKFKYDTAYLFSNLNGYVYPYRGEIYNKSEAIYPGIYMLDDCEYVVIPETDEDKELYSVDRNVQLSPESIFNELSSEIDTVKEPVITDGDVFKPKIKPNDDIILAGIKYCIGNKNNGQGINFNAYGNKFSDVATKNNARRQILKGESLKMAMATRYSDVFDINIMAGFWDKEGCTNPMSPNKKTLYIIFNDDEIDLRDPELDIKVITRGE